MTDIDRLVDLSEGNPGAATALGKLTKTQSDAAHLLDILDAHNIRGPYVWVGFKDHCEKDIDAFAECIRTEDEAMLEEINDYREMRGET